MHGSRYPWVRQTYTAVNKAYKLLLKLQKCQIETKIRPDLLIAIRRVTNLHQAQIAMTQKATSNYTGATWLAAFSLSWQKVKPKKNFEKQEHKDSFKPSEDMKGIH